MATLAAAKAPTSSPHALVCVSVGNGVKVHRAVDAGLTTACGRSGQRRPAVQSASEQCCAVCFGPTSAADIIQARRDWERADLERRSRQRRRTFASGVNLSWAGWT